MTEHATDIDTYALTGIRVLRAGSQDWEDQSHLVDPANRIQIPKENNMRVKCVTCQAVNAISAHEGDEGEVGWGCTECSTSQIIVPATLDQYVPVDTTAVVAPAEDDA